MHPKHKDAEGGTPRSKCTLEFTDLYQAHSRGLVAFFLHRGLSEQDAADAVSETFLRAIVRQKTYDSAQGPVAGWLFGIALNVAREGAQREYRDVRLARRLFGEPIQLTERDVAEFLEIKRTALSILSAIEGLPAEVRRSVVDRVGGVPYEESSRDRDISVAALKKRVSRGRARIRATVEESGHDVL